MRGVHFPCMWNQCQWMRLSRNSFRNSRRKSRVLNHTAENKSYSSWDNCQYLIFVLFYDWLVKIFWFPIQVGQILPCQPKDNVYPKRELVKEDVLISNLSGSTFFQLPNQKSWKKKLKKKLKKVKKKLNKSLKKFKKSKKK